MHFPPTQAPSLASPLRGEADAIAAGEGAMLPPSDAVGIDASKLNRSDVSGGWCLNQCIQPNKKGPEPCPEPI